MKDAVLYERKKIIYTLMFCLLTNNAWFNLIFRLASSKSAIPLSRLFTRRLSGVESWNGVLELMKKIELSFKGDLASDSKHLYWH